jgi:1-acyl-sn-glycerol-3-phosphate acyltransferase
MTTENRVTHQEQRWGPVSRALSRWILKLWGWRVAPFPDIDKVVVVGGPHTSNWDGILGFLGAIALDLDTAFLIKASAFKWPLASILRRTGGIPIDRTRATGVVEQAAELFKHHDRLVMVVTPEGTRTNAPRWKTGFHHIARLAGVPIVLAVPNYAKKELNFPLVLYPGEDMEADMQKMIECFANTTPKRPENLSAPVKAARENR